LWKHKFNSQTLIEALAASKRIFQTMNDKERQPHELPDPATGHRVVLRTSRLGELIERHDLESLSYFIVVDTDRTFMGVVQTADILVCLSATNEIERRKWQEMPVEALLQVRFGSAESPRTAAADTKNEIIACTAITEGSRLLALMRDDDVFLSWSMIHDSVRDTLVDAVTNLPTRAVFERRIPDEFERARRHGNSLGLMLVDVDHFKEINDSFGHSVGDAMLSRLACTIRDNLRSYDFVARYGGDEFIAILSGCQLDCIEIPIRRVQEGVNEVCEGTTLPMPRVSLSIGAAVIHEIDRHQSMADLFELADMCLYQAKEEGRDCAFKIEVAGGSVSPEPVKVETSASHQPPITVEPTTSLDSPTLGPSS
jgi:diguanylate cyclase (GGDEF)-like protein